VSDSDSAKGSVCYAMERAQWLLRGLLNEYFWYDVHSVRLWRVAMPVRRATGASVGEDWKENLW